MGKFLFLSPCFAYVYIFFFLQIHVLLQGLTILLKIIKNNTFCDLFERNKWFHPPTFTDYSWNAKLHLTLPYHQKNDSSFGTKGYFQVSFLQDCRKAISCILHDSFYMNYCCCKSVGSVCGQTLNVFMFFLSIGCTFAFHGAF